MLGDTASNTAWLLTFGFVRNPLEVFRALSALNVEGICGVKEDVLRGLSVGALVYQHQLREYRS